MFDHRTQNVDSPHISIKRKRSSNRTSSKTSTCPSVPQTVMRSSERHTLKVHAVVMKLESSFLLLQSSLFPFYLSLLGCYTSQSHICVTTACAETSAGPLNFQWKLVSRTGFCSTRCTCAQLLSASVQRASEDRSSHALQLVGAFGRSESEGVCTI